MTDNGDRARFTVFLRVAVEGPDAEWEDVARMVSERVHGLGLKRGAGYRVVAAEIDTASDEEEPDHAAC